VIYIDSRNRSNKGERGLEAKEKEWLYCEADPQNIPPPEPLHSWRLSKEIGRVPTSAERAQVYLENEPKPEFELPGKMLVWAYSGLTRVRFKDGVAANPPAGRDRVHGWRRLHAMNHFILLHKPMWPVFLARTQIDS